MPWVPALPDRFLSVDTSPARYIPGPGYQPCQIYYWPCKPALPVTFNAEDTNLPGTFLAVDTIPVRYIRVRGYRLCQVHSTPLIPGSLLGTFNAVNTSPEKYTPCGRYQLCHVHSRPWILPLPDTRNAVDAKSTTVL
jgi:hypothetical protein